MYRSTSDPKNNMEHLFDIPTDGTDPAADSLFNLTSLRTLVSLGQSTPNILLGGDDGNDYYL